MKDNDKITLTVGQIKKLIKESANMTKESMDDDDDEGDEFANASPNIKTFLELGRKAEAFGEWWDDTVTWFSPDEQKITSYDQSKFEKMCGEMENSMNDLKTKFADFLKQFAKEQANESRILKEYEFSDDGYDDEGNYGGPDAKWDWEHRHGGIYSDPDEITPYQRRRKHGKWWPNARGDMPGYGDPETWGGREPR